MKCGLLDALSGRLPNGERLDDIPEELQRRHSILGNLTRLFNTRQGSLLHLPDYGLPDLSDVSRTMPTEDLDALRQAIREAVERFEPRLRRVRVEHETDGGPTSHLLFLLSAEIFDEGRVQFETKIKSDEIVEVSAKRCD